MNNTFRFLLIFVMSIFLIVSCEKDEKVSVSVESVNLSKTSLELEEGKTAELTATVLPKEASNKTITWSSSNQAVATVDENGKVTAVIGGNATITVTSKDGNKTAICEVKVMTSEEYLLKYGFIDSRDGTHYNTVKIGDQIWLAENLKYLPSVNKVDDGSETEAKYYVYAYDGTNVDEAKQKDNYQTYGVLYNWEAAKQSCPVGWHLPSDDEWKTLEVSLGMSQLDADNEGYRGINEGSKMAGNTDLWKASDLLENSEFGISSFTALPGGYQFKGSFVSISEEGYWWSATDDSENFSYSRVLEYSSAKVIRSSVNKKGGSSVRCVKD